MSEQFCLHFFVLQGNSNQMILPFPLLNELIKPNGYHEDDF